MAAGFSLPQELSTELGQFTLLIASDCTLERTSFKTVDHLRATFKNVSSLLSRGGYFVGFVFDSAEMWSRSVSTGPNLRRRDDHSSFSSYGPQPPPSEHLIVKDSFTVANGHIQVEIPRMSSIVAADKEKIDLLAQRPSSRYFGIDTRIMMEGRTELLNICHAESMMEIAKSHGFVCLSFRNLLDFFDSFKTREEDALRKLQVFSKSVPKLLPEQRDAASMMAVFVMQKSS